MGSSPENGADVEAEQRKAHTPTQSSHTARAWSSPEMAQTARVVSGPEMASAKQASSDVARERRRFEEERKAKHNKAVIRKIRKT